MGKMRILALDPGKQKFGYAVLDEEKQVLTQGIETVEKMEEICAVLTARYAPRVAVVGDRTGSKEFSALLQKVFAGRLKLATVNEHASSQEGRRRFLLANRKGWRRLIPLGLQSPSRPYDDYVAVILGERYLDAIGRNPSSAD